MLYRICQLKDTAPSKLLFSSFDYAIKNGGIVGENYESVYTGVYTGDVNGLTKEKVHEILEQLYTKFNVEKPEDYHGRAMSVSDVIILESCGYRGFWYCDNVGFKQFGR